MPKAYCFSNYQSIHNPDALAEYATIAGPALKAAGANFLARGMPAAIKEQGRSQRVVLIEFESLQIALDAYNSPGYKEALAILGDSAVVRDIRINEGL